MSSIETYPVRRLNVDGVDIDIDPFDAYYERETVTETLHSDSLRRVPLDDWSTVDAAGHFHAFNARGARHGDRNADWYPSLEARTRPCDGACGDPEHTDTYLVCRACGEEIEPGYRLESQGPVQMIVGVEEKITYKTSAEPFIGQTYRPPMEAERVWVRAEIAMEPRLVTGQPTAVVWGPAHRLLGEGMIRHDGGTQEITLAGLRWGVAQIAVARASAGR